MEQLIEAGQLWRQYAVINTEKGKSADQISIILLAPDSKIIQTVDIDRKEFKRNFVKDLKDTHCFVRLVKITEVDSSNVKFVRIDRDTKQTSDTQTLSKKLFLKNFSYDPLDQQVLEA